MIELMTSLLFNENNIISKTIPFPTTVTSRIVCSKFSKNTIYYIRTCERKHAQVVNRCTYLANDIGNFFVKEEDKKWCNKDKSNYKSVWIYN